MFVCSYRILRIGARRHGQGGGGMPSIGKCKGQTRFNYNLLVRTKTTKIVDKHASPVQIASMAGAPPLAR